MDNVRRMMEILLIEDSDDDIFFISRALKDVHIVKNNLSIVKDGNSALDFLYRKGDYQKSPRPDLILLDLNLPEKPGVEVLEDIKNNEQLKGIPVIVLTSSEDQKTINRVYDAYANSYVTKPVQREDIVKVINTINKFWGQIVHLPPDND